MVKERCQQLLQREGKKSSVAELNRGAWTAEEDQKLVDYVKAHGDRKWRILPSKAGLKRCGKSCRLRWLNYLRPGIKRGNISEDEEDLIIRLHNLLGNRWSIIAGRIPGRTDNEIKNHWHTHLRKRSLSMEDLNNKLNHSPDNLDSTKVSTGPPPPPPSQTVLNSSADEIMLPTLQPAADKNQGPMVSRAASEFDMERLFEFGSELGLDNFGLLPSHHHDNNGNRDQFFEFEDLEQWLDYQQIYALDSPISG